MSVVVDSVDGDGAVCLVSSCRWCAMFLNNSIEMRHGWRDFGSSHLFGNPTSSALLDRSTSLLLLNEHKRLGFEFEEDCINV